MTWQAPKTNWHPTQPEDLKGEDLNEIGTNLNYLKNEADTLRIVSGCGVVVTIQPDTDPNSFEIVQKSTIRLPAGKKLYLKRAIANLSSSNLRLGLRANILKLDGTNLIEYDPVKVFEVKPIAQGVAIRTGQSTLDYPLPGEPMLLIRDNNDTVLNVIDISVLISNVSPGTIITTEQFDGWTLQFVIE